MKKETAKKNKLWLWIGLGVVALLAVVGIVLALVLGQGQGQGGRADLYWNVDRAAYTQSESGLSSREPAADGMYYIKFAYNGEQVELPVADKRLVNFIDTMDLMGLVIDRDGIVTDAVDVTQVAVEKGKGIYFVEATDTELVANSAVTLNGLAMRFAITENTQIYNVSVSASMVGELIQGKDIQVMDSIHVYANDQDEITHVYLVEPPLQSKIYWRMDQMWDGTQKDTTREPDEKGVYTIPYWCEGEEVEIKTKDRKLVAEIDNRSFYWCHSAFRFDEEGYAAARINTGTATRTISLVDCYDVMEIDGNNISTQPFGNGTPVNFKVTENTKIYDVSNLAKALGTAGQQVDSLQINDRVSVWTDKDGNAVTIYVASRRCDSPIYFNVERQWSGAEKSTKRTPNADGLYEIELWSEATGKQTYLMNKEQVDFVDAEGYRVCGLKADGKLVQEVYPFEAIFGYPAVCNGRWVTDITGSIITILSPANLTETNWIMSADCKVYDMSGQGEYGAVTELRVGDNVKVFRNPPGEIVCMIIDSRQTGLDSLYYNLNRQYDDKLKETKRLPDENGWYVFDVAHNGKTKQVKTKSKEIASQFEALNPGAAALFVNNGVIQKVFDPVVALGGKKVASAFYFEGYDEEGKAVFGYEGRDDLSYVVSENMIAYDVSTNNFNNRGSVTTLQKGDWVTCFTDMYGELRVVYVRGRKADAAGYNFERMYDAGKATTTRKPDADGWYVFQMAIDGKCKTLKTKNKDLATMIDYQNTAVGLTIKGDEIMGYTNANMIPGISATGVRGYDVIKVDGNKLTVRYTVTGSVNTGKEQVITLASNAKVYDVSTGDVATFGQKMDASAIKVGDRLTTLKDAKGNHALIYVTHKGNRAAGYVSYCPHCDKEVYWCAWSMDGFNSGDDSHVYLFRDINTSKQLSMGNKDLQYTVVIDLNGYTWTRTTEGRAISVSYKESLYILDTVGTGKIRSTGAMGQNAGVLSIGTGSKVHLLGGTLEQIESDVKVPAGGIVNMSGDGSEFHMSGGKLVGGKASDYQAGTVSKNGMGGSIYASNGIVDITGGVIEGGHADYCGGNIFFYGATSINIENATITGGEAGVRGGNIYINSGVAKEPAAVIKNCQILDGVAGDKGGNIYNDAPNATLTDCTISGGKAGMFGHNVFHSSGTLNVVGGSVVGGDFAAKSGTLVLTGPVKVDLMNLTGAQVNVSGLTKGASIKVNAEGDFTTDYKNIKDILEAGYIQPATAGAVLEINGKKLTMSGAEIPTEPGLDVSDPSVCPHCGVKWDQITWTAWTGEHDPASGHYRLEKDMTTAHTNIGNSQNFNANIVLDLNGHILKAENGDYAMGVGLNKVSQITLTIMDRVGGGEIQATGKSKASAGVMSVVNNAKLNIISGTLRQLPSSDVAVVNAGVLYVQNATLNMYGGKIADGRIASTQDATAGNVLLRNSTVFNMYGGEITNGYAAKSGGGVNVYGSVPKFNMYGGSITNNTSVGDGGNVYVSGGTATIGGTSVISGGVGKNTTSNIACTGTLTINGGMIDGGVSGKFKTLTLAGNPVIKGIEVASGKLLTLGELTAGAEIWVNAKGVFTEVNAKTEEYAAYFKPKAEGGSIAVVEVTQNGVKGKALSMTGGSEIEGPAFDVNDNTICPHCGVKVKEITWTAWTGEDDPTTGHYRLESNVAFDHANIGNAKHLDADIVLDLNGKTWKADGDYIMGIGLHDEANVTVSIIDTVGGGKLQGTGKRDDPATEKVETSAIGVISVMKSSTLNIYGGTLEHVRANDIAVTNAGVLYINGANLNMYGGKITGGYVASNASATAGNVLLRGNTTFNMFGGEISNGYAAFNGGGVNSYTARTATNSGVVFNMIGGSIKNNTAENEGGNIYISGGTVNISGTAEISGGLTKGRVNNITVRDTLNISGGTIDGGISGKCNVFTLSGNPVIKANTVGLMIAEGRVITLGELTEGAEIYVNAEGVFTEENAKAAEYAKYFKTNIQGGSVVAEGNTLAVVGGQVPEIDVNDPTICPHCGVKLDQIYWHTWTGAHNPADGHYRLEENLTTAHANIGNGLNIDADIVLDLNGKTWKANDGDYLMGIGFEKKDDQGNLVWVSAVKMSIMDSVGGGELQATGKTGNAAVITATHNTRLNIYGGTLRQLPSNDVKTQLGVVYARTWSGAKKPTTINMYGGKITGGYTESTASDSAGNVLLRGVAIFNMYGGEISGGKAAATSGGVHAYGTATEFNMLGGTIKDNIGGVGTNVYCSGGKATIGGTAVISGGNVVCTGNLTVSGNPVITDLEIPANKKITLGDLTTGADICVNANGAFTAENAKASEYVGYFKTNVEGHKVVAENNVLKVTEDTGTGNEPDPNAKCPCCDKPLTEIVWETWNETNAQAVKEGGHYRLEAKLESGKINFGSAANPNDFTLDLNGNTWTNNSGYLMHIGAGVNTPCTVNIFDSVGGGELQGYGAGDYGVIYVANGSKLVLHSGTIRQLENTSSQTRGAVYVYNGKMEMKGGKITDGYTKKSGLSAGNLLVRGTAEFTMTGGEITNGYALTQGGGVAVVGGTFTVSGGKIYNNTTDGTGNNVFIEARTADNATVTATIGGTAEITNGNVVCNDNLTVSGKPVISELKLSEGKTITLGELTTGADICVNATGVFTTENAKASEYVGYFKTNVEGHKVVAENNVLKVTEDTGAGNEPDPNAKCPHCDVALSEITWNDWKGTSNPAEGHYRLNNDLTTEAHAELGDVSYVCLDLNGHVWRVTGSDYALDVGTNSNTTTQMWIIDTADKDGEIQAAGKGGDAGVVKVINGTKLVLHGGTIRQLYTADATTLGAVYINGANFDMHGGKITDGYTTSTAATSAGNLLVRGATSVMNMYGGEITNGHAVTNGGGVTTYGTFNMSGGTISNNVSDGIGGNICVNGGTPTFSNNAEVKNGVAGKGANIYNKVASAKFENVSKIDGDVYTIADVTLEGSVYMPMGNSNGIFIEATVKNNVAETKGKLKFVNFDKTNSKIFFGVGFTDGNQSAVFTDGGAEYLDCFKNVGRTTSVEVDGTNLKANRTNHGNAVNYSYCPHCGEEAGPVNWFRTGAMTEAEKDASGTATGFEVFNAANVLDSEGKQKFTHFFSSGSGLANGLKFTGEVVIDLAGETRTSSQQMFILEGEGSKLAVLDTVGGGKLVGKGNMGTETANHVANGGVINVAGATAKATVSIYSGTISLTVVNTDTAKSNVVRGGLISVNGGDLNIYGGILTGGKTNHSTDGGAGGNIYMNNGKFTMTGGLITGGTARQNGGNIYVNTNATAEITGGMVEKGTVLNQRGGNLFLTCKDSAISNLIVRGGAVTGTDTAKVCGGNIAISAQAKFTLNNVVMAGGTAINGGNLSVEKVDNGTQNPQCELTNCVIYGGTATGTGNDTFTGEGITLAG